MTSTSQPSEFQVQGTITDLYGDAIPALQVSVHEKILGNDRLLTQGVTDALGEFQLTCLLSETYHGSGATEIFISVSLNDQWLANSQLFRTETPGTIITIDLPVPDPATGDIPEYRQMVNLLNPHVVSMDLNDFNQDDFEILINETQGDVTKINDFIHAKRLKKKLGLREDFLYALMREGLSPNANELLHTASDTRRNALLQAIDQSIIAVEEAQKEQIIDDFLSILDLLKPAFVFEGEIGPIWSHYKIGAAISLLDLPSNEQISLLNLFLEYVQHQDAAQFEREVQNLLSPLHSGWLLSFWTGYDFRDEVFSFSMSHKHPFFHFWDFGTLSLEDWGRWFYKDAPETDAFDIYQKGAELLPDKVKLAPTAYLVNSLLNIPDYPLKSAVSWLKQNPVFDFRFMSADTYLSVHPDTAQDFDLALLREELARMEQAFHLGQENSILVKTLLAKNLDQIKSIKDKDKSAFITQVKTAQNEVEYLDAKNIWGEAGLAPEAYETLLDDVVFSDLYDWTIPFSVSGKITSPASKPIPDLKVVAFHVYAEGEIRLGESVTSAKGNYKITYFLQALRKVSEKKPNLLLRVYATRKEQSLLAKSELVSDAGVSLKLSLIADPKFVIGKTEFRLVKDNLPFDKDPSIEDHAVWAKEISETMSARDNLVSSEEAAILEELFYGLLRAGGSYDPVTLINLSAAAQTQLIASAVESQVIASKFLEPIENTLEVLNKLRSVSWQFDVVAPAAKRASVGYALSLSGLSNEDQNEVYNQYLLEFEQAQDTELVINELANRIKDKTPYLRGAWQFVNYAGYHIPIRKQLNDLNITNISGLAALSIHQWLALLERRLVSFTTEEKIQWVCGSDGWLYNFIQSELATPYFTHTLLKQQDFAEHLGVRFLKENTSFQLGLDTIDSYLERHSIKITTEQLIRLKPAVYLLQRVFHLSGKNPILAEALLLSKLDSSEKIKRSLADGELPEIHEQALRQNILMHYSGLLQEFEGLKLADIETHLFFTAELVNELVRQALAQYAYLVNLIAYHNDLNNFKGFETSIDEKDIPQLTDLFGSLNYAQCDPCLSVLSPSAYLIDILGFLREIKHGRDWRRNALDQLLLRRPDINTLQLNCSNTYEEAPYLEMVNEILENAVIRTALENVEGDGGIKVMGKVFTQTGGNIRIVRDVKVEALIHDARYGQVVATSTTIGESEFELMIDAATIQTNTGDMYPDIYFRVYQEDRLVYFSQKPDIRNVRNALVEIDLAVKKTEINEYNQEASHWLKGTIAQKITHEPIKGLTIEAWEKDSKKDDLIGITNTASNGSYVIRFDQKDYREHPKEYKPVIYYKIYSKDQLILNTVKEKTKNQKFSARELVRDFQVDHRPEDHNQSNHMGVETVLTETIYPWNFPVDLNNEESSIILDDLKLSKHHLINLLESDSESKEEKLARATFNLSVFDTKILFNDLSSVGIHPYQHYGLENSSWLNTREKDVKELLDITGLKLEQLNELLHVEFINPSHKAIVFATEPLGLENAFSAKLAITAKELDRLQRFVRLSEKTDWSYSALDQLMRAFKAKEIDKSLLVNLMHTRTLQAQLNLDIGALCSIFDSIDTKIQPSGESTFDQLFPGSSGIEFDFEKRELKKKNLILDKKNRELRLAVMNAFNISEDELNYLLEAELKTNKLTYRSLCHLHRLILFSRSTQLDFRDFHYFKLLTGINPANAIDPKTLGYYLRLLDKLMDSGFLLKEAAFLLSAESSDLYLTEEDLSKILTNLANALQTVSNETKPEINSDELKKLKEHTAGNVLAREMATDRSLITSMLLQTPSGFQEPILSSIIDNDDLLIKEISSENFPQLYDGLQWINKVKWVTEKLQLSDLTFRQVLENAAGLNFCDLRNLPVNTVEVLAIDPWIDFIEAIGFNHRHSTDDEDVFMFLNKHVLNPILTDPGNKTNEVWLKALRAKVQKQFNWSEESVAYVMDHLELYNLSLHGLKWLYKINDVSKVSKTHGIGIKDLDTLRTLIDNPSAKDLGAIRIILKSNIQDRRWKELSELWHEVILERKRDVFRDYLIAHNHLFKDSNDIYNYYLIDAEMSACADTSRIKQVISAVQLFVQRIGLSLEDQLALSKDNQKEWLWRKNYRIWEANRKVFLFPENWLLPELRKNRTPFYDEFMDELKQSPVNEQAFENLYLKYLTKLDDISHLEVSGIYNDHEEGNHYIFGRTREHPHRYLYAQRIKGQYWTPWETIQADIQGDHLIPAKQNNRLMIIWPQFMEKARKGSTKISTNNTNTNETYEGQEPVKYHEIELGYTVLENGGWSAKKISAAKVEGNSSKTNSYHLDLETDELLKLTIGVTDTINGQMAKNSFGHFQLSARGNVLSKQENQSSTTLHPSIQGTTMQNNRFVQQQPSGNLRENYLDRYGGRREAQILAFQTPQSYYTIYGSLIDFKVSDPFVFEDQERTYYVDISTTAANLPRKYRFELFYHPYTKVLMDVNNRFGLRGILDPQSINLSSLPTDLRKVISGLRQQAIVNEDFNFQSDYNPSPINVDHNYPKEEIDFHASGIYSEYNWELFFHIPLTIALEFSRNKKFEEAQKWFHYIFNPTEPEDRSAIRNRNGNDQKLRFWKLKPFYEYEGISTITGLMRLLHEADEGLSESEKKQKEDLLTQIELWEDSPFDPHVVARFRTVSYMKMVVMKYLDNLLAWGDHLFGMDSIESINEATQLYILAQQILGDRPDEKKTPMKYTINVADALAESGAFSNVLADIEAQFPLNIRVRPSLINSDGENITAISSMSPLYFCMPANDQLMNYWDLVHDRLFKIRHCMNLEGVKRKLALFQPPIDPSMLVRATAQGVDLGSILAEPTVALTPYRFITMVQKANEMVNIVKSLGNNLLSTLEKKDGEALALLRADQELKVLDMMRQIKTKTIDEARHSHTSLTHSKQLVTDRKAYYDSREYMNQQEIVHLDKMEKSRSSQVTAQDWELAAGWLTLIPSFYIGTNGIASPAIHAEFGGPALASAARAMGLIYSHEANKLSSEGNLSSVRGSYDRRTDEWTHQSGQALTELSQIQEQINAAMVRKQIAERDLEAHDLQIENAQKNEEFLTRKYTNKDLYQWMIGETSTIYFQSYQLAFQLAKKAEKAFGYELGIEDPGFLEFGYWDSMKKGLLSADKLEHDLKRLEMAFYDQNERCMELTKHVSLGTFFPHELQRLKETGACDFALPEELFDLDHPGHYTRRIKSVSLTIPCITGPYTNINCELTMTRSQWRKDGSIDPDNLDEYPWSGNVDDDRFYFEMGTSRSIATSSAQNDSGLFELNFRDERYLPFEGAGAISQWHLEFPESFRQFDYDSISDVIVHINYTAKRGSSILRDAAQLALETQLNKMVDYFSEERKNLQLWLDLKTHFSDAYHKLFSIADNNTSTETEIEITPNYLPFFLREREVRLKELTLLVVTKEEDTLSEIKVSIGLAGKNWPALKTFSTENNISQASFSSTQLVVNPWKIKLSGPGVKSLKEDMIESFVLIGDYTIS